MPQSQMPYGDRTVPVRCHFFLQNRTVAVACFTHRTMRREVFTRRCIFSRHCFDVSATTNTARSPYGGRRGAAG